MTDHYASHTPHLSAAAPLDTKWLTRFDELFERHTRRQALRRAVMVSSWSFVVMFLAVWSLLLLAK
ncbi:hypothetical protein [Sinorhizobium meliloti]|uniref:hypothetical protein n=1 Tax=Rhizobium meliloti TaxID=382 RepID=UPI000FD6CD19|nr:hypothetical protein [Sinorhizobium meliloti]RVJ93080.1 hypothetical protein CN169_12765 [Sinorhizobium meliloti]